MQEWRGRMLRKILQMQIQPDVLKLSMAWGWILIFNIFLCLYSNIAYFIHSSRWKIMTYYFVSLEKLVRNMNFIYPLVWWKLGYISLLNIPWFMPWLYLSPALIVRFLQDKTKRSVTLKCKIWQLQDFFLQIYQFFDHTAVNLILWKHQKTHIRKSVFQWSLLRWHDEPIYLTWFQDFIFFFHNSHTRLNYILHSCVHYSWV